MSNAAARSGSGRSRRRRRRVLVERATGRVLAEIFVVGDAVAVDVAAGRDADRATLGREVTNLAVAARSVLVHGPPSVELRAATIARTNDEKSHHLR